MGNVCNKTTSELVRRKPAKPDFKFREQTGSNESIFTTFDYLNIYKQYSVQEILYLFLATNDRKTGYVQDVDYNVFVENKLIRNFVISDWIINETSTQSQIKDFSVKFFDIFGKAFKTIYKTVKGEKFTGKGIPTICLLPFGFIYGSGRTDTKVELVFNLFANDEDKLELTHDLQFFIFSALAIPGAVTLIALKDSGEENEAFAKKLEGFDFQKIFDTYQIKDTSHATEEYVKLLFTPEKPSLTFEDFISLIQNNEDLQSIFSAGGARRYLEKNNI